MARKRLIASLLICSMLVVLLASCSGKAPQEQSSSSQSVTSAASSAAGESSKSGEKAKLLIYHYMGEMADYLNSFCEKFNSEHPDIELSTELQKDSSTLQIKYAAGEDPDIVFGAASQKYIDLGKYLDFTPHTDWLDRVAPVMKQLFTDVKTGGIYKLPMGRGFTGVFYNKQIFDEAGIQPADTWDKFIENLKAVKKAKPDIIPFYIVSNDYFNMTQYGPYAHKTLDLGIVEMKKAVSTNDKAALDWGKSGGYIETFGQKLLDMKAAGLIDSELALTSTQEMLSEAFATGKVAATITGTFWSGPLLRQFPDVAKFIGVAPLPSLDGRGGYVGSSSDSAVSMSAVSKYRDQIFTVVDYLFKPENLKSYCSARRVACSFNDVQITDWSPIAGQIQDLWAKYPNIAAPDIPTGFPTSEWSKLGQELIVGTYDAKKYAQTFNEKWNAAY